MQYVNLVISIMSLINIFLILIAFFSKKRVKTFETETYSGILIINTLTVLLEIFSFLILQKTGYNSYIYLFLMKAILCCYLAWVQLFFLYMLTISKGNNLNVKKVSRISIVLYLILALIIFILPIEYIIKDGLYIPSGIPSAIVYGFSGICDLLMIYLFIRYGKNTLRKKYVPMIVLIIFSCIVVLFQMNNPEYFLMTAMLVYTTVLMYFTIENPDVKMIEQLELAKDSADKANAAKTDFLSSMSHEIRTPLNAIVGFSDCIKNSNDLSEAKENADDIINASNTLLEIVNGILDISKIEAGKLEIINSNYNAANLFSGLAKLMTPKMNEKGLDFQVTIAPDLPNVLYGDSANIKKVVTNLLSNAYKYTDNGFVKYDVKCVNANGICRLIVTVTDSGRGIKKESINKLFTKFQRVDEDRNTTIEGTGLGLAITKQLVELMGGTVVVDSVYGEGSKFTITLDQRIENVEVVEEKNTYDTIDLTGKKILVVDDNSINLKVARKLLERYKATVEVCDSGFKCIELINSGAMFDLILMDDMMPKMSGTQTLQKLKEKETFKIPVFALTANAITGMKERYLSAGFDNYLAKPIEKEAMFDAFNKLFNNKENVSIKEEQEKAVTTSETENEPEVGEAVVEEVNNESVVKNVEYLKANNIDVDHGLELLGDIELYNDTMNDFIDEINKRLPLLDEYKKNGDMPNYAILVHAIKSDCKYLGIMALADINYEHELKSKANDVEFVNNNYDKLINMIEDYVTICKKYLDRD